MDIKLKISGAAGVALAMRHAAGKVPNLARKRMHRGANRIVRNARKMAPYLTGALERSIQKVVAYGYRNRLRIDIVVGGGEVDRYVIQMHEGDYELGPESQAKQDRQKEIVGPKFLERAVDAEAVHIRKYIQDLAEQRVQKYINTKTGLEDDAGDDAEGGDDAN